MTGRPVLSPAAVLVFRHVLEHGLGRRELGEGIPGVGPDPLRDAVGELAGVGLLRRSARPDREWEVIAPDVAATWLVEQQRAEMAAQQLHIARIRMEFNALQPLYAQLRGARIGFEEVADVDEARSFVTHHLDRSPEADVLACSMTPGPVDGEDGIAALLDPARLGPGHRLRLVVPAALRGSDVAAALGLPPAAEVRCAWSVPFTAVLLDGRVGAVRTAGAPCPGGPPGTVQVFDSGQAVGLLGGVTGTLWATSSPVGAVPRSPRSEVWTDIVRRLAVGEKDERIARELRIGVRTVRRHIAELMRELGAVGRFEAGMLAERAGWLAEDGRTGEALDPAGDAR